LAGAGLALAAVFLILALVVCGAFALRAVGGQRQRVAASATTTARSQALIPSDGPWQSWAAANSVLALALGPDGHLLTGGFGSVTRWRLADGTPSGQMTTGNGLPSSNVLALLTDPDTGTVWIATAEGLAAVRQGGNNIYDQADGLDSSYVSALALTRQGLLAGTQYAGRPGAGLNRFTDNGWRPVPGFPSSDTGLDPDLLSSNVSALLEDSRGEVWVGTSNGLGRYDGSAWQRYGLEEGLPAIGVSSLAEVEGEVWVGTHGGLARFAGGAFEQVPALAGLPVFGILTASNGEVWVAAGGALARRAAAGQDWTLYDSTQLPSYSVYGGLEGPDGALYFGSDDGVVRFAGEALEVWRAPNLPTQPGYGAILDGPAPGQIWFIQEYGTRLDVFDLAAGAWQPSPPLPCDYCVPLARDADGRLWAGGDLGLWIVETDGQAAAHLTSAEGLPADGVYSVAFGPNGEAWLGTPGGVALYDGASVVETYTAASAGLASDFIGGLWFTSDGSLWVATDVNLSRRGPGGDWEHFAAGHPFEWDVRINDLAEAPDGALWVATAGNGVYRYAQGAWTQFKPGENRVRLPSTDVQTITAAPDGSLWFGLVHAGAAHFDGGEWQVFTRADGLIHPHVNAIYLDEAGGVWFATSGGVSRYQP
jgi:ligand-binding sensor domain-containing protein